MKKSTTIYDYLEFIDTDSMDRDSVLDQAIPAQVRSMTHNDNVRLNGFTITLRPQWHRVDPKTVRRMLSNQIREMYFKTHREIGIEIHCEFTKASVLHFHGTIYCSKVYHIARFLAKMRKTYGFVKTETIKYLEKWNTYCSKRDELNPIYFYKKK